MKCSECGNIFAVDRSVVKRDVKEIGYKCKREINYYIQCPRCFKRTPVKLKQLSFKLRWKMFMEMF